MKPFCKKKSASKFFKKSNLLAFFGIVAFIRIGQDIQCLPYAEFFQYNLLSTKNGPTRQLQIQHAMKNHLFLTSADIHFHKVGTKYPKKIAHKPCMTDFILKSTTRGEHLSTTLKVVTT